MHCYECILEIWWHKSERHHPESYSRHINILQSYCVPKSGESGDSQQCLYINIYRSLSKEESCETLCPFVL